MLQQQSFSSIISLLNLGEFAVWGFVDDSSHEGVSLRNRADLLLLECNSVIEDLIEAICRRADTYVSVTGSGSMIVAF